MQPLLERHCVSSAVLKQARTMGGWAPEWADWRNCAQRSISSRPWTNYWSAVGTSVGRLTQLCSAFELSGSLGRITGLQWAGSTRSAPRAHWQRRAGPEVSSCQYASAANSPSNTAEPYWLSACSAVCDGAPAPGMRTATPQAQTLSSPSRQASKCLAPPPQTVLR